MSEVTASQPDLEKSPKSLSASNIPSQEPMHIPHLIRRVARGCALAISMRPLAGSTHD